jgi:dihydroxyacid dehydratase/phosphogluconate dehydratase
MHGNTANITIAEGPVIKRLYGSCFEMRILISIVNVAHAGPAKIFTTVAAALRAIKCGAVSQGDVIVLICGGPLGAGMQEIYQVTSALKNLPFCKHVAVLTDARFSGVSIGACLGHISPKALAGGPIGRVRDGDTIEIVSDRNNLHGTATLLVKAWNSFPQRRATVA